VAINTPTATTPAARAGTRRQNVATRVIRAREPQRRFKDLDRKTKRFLAQASVTLLAAILLFGYLLPLLFMSATAVKSEDQLANGRILPMSPVTVEIDGEQYPLYKVPIDGTTQQLALVKPGRRLSTFVDPADPTVEIPYEGNWRTLEASSEFDPRFSNFGDAWSILKFGRMYMNTLIIAGLGMAGTLIASTMVAYGLSRFRMPFKTLILGSLLATIILPRFVTLVPTYWVYNQLGWIGTFKPLIVPHFFANAYNVFLLRQFFLTIPKEMDEAAAIDGAGPVKTLLTVILPQAKGALVAVALFHFFFAWNDFLEPLIYLGGKQDKLPISVGLYQFLNIYDTNIPLVQAAALIAMGLPLLLFIVLQRVFLRGIDLSGSLK
jgi:multiple sugar transport system permease protein